MRLRAPFRASIRTSMNGLVARSSQSTSATSSTTATPSSHHSPAVMSSRNTSSAETVPVISTMPNGSSAVSTGTSASVRGRSRSEGSQSPATTSPNAASGTFTRKIACQPNAAMRAPPRGGPAAADTSEVIDSAPSTSGGVGLPMRRECCRSVVSAAGYADEVPMPMSTRANTAPPNPVSTSGTTPAIPTTTSPAMKTFFGPKRSASLPIVGCAIALAR